MKKILLLMMCCPAMLAAQNGNGVTVSNLAVHAGTVTFNVSWKKADMPTLWSDSVWVFVDYNKNGVMTRLPVTGATATAGTVTKIQGNDKGAWVVGNARSAGNFSATVQLLTDITDVAGVCAYASNYPPVGEYTAEHEISFTGTPPYNLVLVSAGSGTRTYSINDSYYILYEGETLQSFSDKTGAPGTKINECHAPGSTVTFTAFNPCSNAATYSVWYLEDTRESNNIKTYKVKKMADGHIWMAQDLAFGNLCPLNSVSANGVSSILGSSYGKCINLTNGSPSSVNGYFYDWSATMNGPDNQSGCSGTSSGTSDTNPGACQGICPVGWHIPTGNTTGELYALYNAMGNCASNCNLCWGPDSPYEGVARGRYGDLACGVRCWSSTPISSTRAYMMLCGCNSSSAGTFNEGHEYLTPVRCIRNY